MNISDHVPRREISLAPPTSLGKSPRISLRRQVLVPLLATGLLLFSLVSWMGSHLYHQMLNSRLRDKAEMVANTVQSAAGVAPHSSYLQRMVDATAAQSEVSSVIIFADNPPRVLVCARRNLVGVELEDLQDRGLAAHATEVLHRQTAVHHNMGGVMFRYVAPITLSTDDGQVAGQTPRGAVLVEIDSKPTAHGVMHSLGVWALLTFAAVAVLWLLAWALLRRHVLTPLAGITEALRQSAAHEGKLVMPELEPNEIGSLAASLERTFARLGESEQRSQMTLRELALQKQTLDEHAIVSETDARGRIVYVNSKFREISGYSYDELLGQDHRIVNSGFHPQVFWGDMYITLAKKGVWHGEICNRAKNGELYWVQTTNAAFKDIQGRLLGYVSICTDVTERRRTEQANRKLASRMHAILQNAGHAIIATDTDGIIQLFNPAAEAMLGYAADEVVGLETLLLFHDLDELCQQAAERGLETCQPVEWSFSSYVLPARLGLSNQQECTYIRKDGSKLTVLFTLTALTDSDGSLHGFLGVASDITQRKLIELEIHQAKDEAEQANRQLAEALADTKRLALAAKQATAAKSAFLANMSHEIRTPMTAILGYSDLLLDDEGASRAQREEALQTIRRNGQHLLELINDILDLSKIEAGRLETETMDVPVWDLLEEIHRTMRVRARQKGIEISLHAATPLPATCQTDPVRLRQVLVNLVGNAIKFTERGSVKVIVSYRVKQGRGILRFDVEDTGIGMAPQQLSRLFRPFSQADSSTTRRFGGTGLGLTISRRLVQLLGGKISVRSKLHVGSTFSVTVCAGVASAAKNLGESSPAWDRDEPRASEDSNGRLAGRVLLAEDGPDNQRLIGLMLRKAGLEVSIADNGSVAVEQIQRAKAAGDPFQLILMDMQMPELDGYDATRQLRALGYREPIIALTAHAMSGDRERCLSAGCSDYLSKPVDWQLLLSAIRKALRNEGAPASGALG